MDIIVHIDRLEFYREPEVSKLLLTKIPPHLFRFSRRNPFWTCFQRGAAFNYYLLFLDSFYSLFRLHVLTFLLYFTVLLFLWYLLSLCTLISTISLLLSIFHHARSQEEISLYDHWPYVPVVHYYAIFLWCEPWYRFLHPESSWPLSPLSKSLLAVFQLWRLLPLKPNEFLKRFFIHCQSCL